MTLHNRLPTELNQHNIIMANILIIDDEKAIRKTLSEILGYEGYKIDEAADGAEGFKMFQAKTYDAVLCDIKMPKMDGLEFLEKSKEINPDIPVIIISGHGNIDTAVEAVKKGAYDYISKPPDLNRLLITLRNALDKTSLVKETRTLRKKITKTQEMIGNSAPILKIKETVEKVAATDARVLVTGENGVGKELVARWLHQQSHRAAGPLVEVNCAAIPGELIESELFGHEKGSFTSAVKQRIGKFEQASGGTLFLDEIGDMSMSAQAKVLRALQEGRITRVGGDKEIAVDVRVVAATNKDLLREVEDKNFRLDLYHRLSVILIHVPSLNERRDDIPLLVDHFLDNVCKEYGIAKKAIDPAALKALQEYNWTGNIRELRNVVERLVILSGKVIMPEDVDDYVLPARDKKRVNT
ncbi:DNA-binding transcriptional response regulator, NtrC family, contains REC, AAA-type ATPase, and a Fis-type DNA-binding domains [Chitinophaga costaii]|uniref:DNA-binding transcriptional response regulator, NtrC family, contains REC, AAA-type ATPase, and a Fis-type DNA-binding domains n=2 Tax=Chitinophaga costaii TaxID=1335309 RepID=A0A1C4FX49_9BACT|nr:DNA-binding transcriptional response regulator, NtrC family, contains REC, AAA-type ATPase, and a Fis-type DNA-binding domains [Chitinophaga costaii]